MAKTIAMATGSEREFCSVTIEVEHIGVFLHTMKAKNTHSLYFFNELKDTKTQFAEKGLIEVTKPFNETFAELMLHGFRICFISNHNLRA